MILVIVGDIQSARVVQMISKTFADTRARRPAQPAPPFGYVAHRGNKSFYHFEKEAGKTRISIETLEDSPPFVDNRAYRRERLLAVLGSRILQNRIDARIGKQGTPYTDGSAGTGVFLNRIKYSEISAECNPDNWEKTLVALETLLRRALVFGFTEAELDRVRKDYRANLEHAVKNASTRQSPGLARHIIRQINSKRVVLAPVQERDLITAMLDTITLEQVNQALGDNWSADHRLIIVTGNADLAKTDRRPEQLILDTYNRSRARAVKKPPAAATPQFPYFDIPEKKGRVVRSTRVADLGILQFDLSNGVQVNLKPTDFEADRIAVRVDFGRGRSSEPMDKPGLGPLTESVINESGLGTFDKDTLKQALAGKNLEVDFKVTEDRFRRRSRP
jgi:zinc protease